MSRPRSSLARGALALAVLGGLGAGGCAGKDSGAGAGAARPPPLVSVAKVEARDVPVEVRAPVDLRPLVQADVGSKTLGYLDAVEAGRTRLRPSS